MLYPFIRVNRALTSVLIYPQEPIKAIAFSEITSIILPLINPYMYKNIINLIMLLSYAPKYSNEILKFYTEKYNTYNQAEISCLLLFILTYTLDKYY
jgi:hypothetical protein